MKSFEDVIDEIIANMDKQREKAKTKAFVTDISMMLRENGVIPMMTEVTAEIDSDDALKTAFGCRLEKLDFSEHDKVFEDNIAELKKDYKTASELLGKYQQENESLKKRIVELENFSCQAEQETGSLVEKLTQRIDELESKEAEKQKTSHIIIVAKEINGQTYVKFEDFMFVVNNLQSEIGT